MLGHCVWETVLFEAGERQGGFSFNSKQPIDVLDVWDQILGEYFCMYGRKVARNGTWNGKLGVRVAAVR